MEELPDLPFEQILIYLSLVDRLKARNASKGWRKKFDSYPVKTLCFSMHQRDRILGKRQWVNGIFAENFISSRQFSSFFDTFGQTILSNLKHLRFCDLTLNEEHRSAFASALNSFGQLQELGIIRFNYPPADSKLKMNFELNLPMLHSIHLEKVRTIARLTLRSPRLKNVKVVNSCGLHFDLVHAESVERLIVDWLNYIEVKELKNLQYLNTFYFRLIDSTLPSSLRQLKEIHLVDMDLKSSPISNLFEQKKRFGRTNLKIYLFGLLLNGPSDPVTGSLLSIYSARTIAFLAANLSRMAEEMPFYPSLHYTDIESLSPDLQTNILKRFTGLKRLIVDRPIQSTERFLGILNRFANIRTLHFFHEQPHDLLDRLPEYSAVQKLVIGCTPSDFRFLFSFKDLLHLKLYCSIDAKTARKLLEDLQFLCTFEFQYYEKRVKIENEASYLNPFRVSVGGKMNAVADLNAAMQFITEHRL